MNTVFVSQAAKISGFFCAALGDEKGSGYSVLSLLSLTGYAQEREMFPIFRNSSYLSFHHFFRV